MQALRNFDCLQCHQFQASWLLAISILLWLVLLKIAFQIAFQIVLETCEKCIYIPLHFRYFYDVAARTLCPSSFNLITPGNDTGNVTFYVEFSSSDPKPVAFDVKASLLLDFMLKWVIDIWIAMLDLGLQFWIWDICAYLQYSVCACEIHIRIC